MRGKHLWPEIRYVIIYLHVIQGLGYRKISKETGYSVSAIQTTIWNHKVGGILGEKARSGRPQESTKREDRTLVQKSLADRHLANPPLKAEWELSTGVDVSTRTVRRRLCENGLKGCGAREKPLVAQAQTQKLDCCPMAKSTVLRWKPLWCE